MTRLARLAPVLVLLVLPFAFLHRGFAGDPDALLGARNWDMTTLFYPQRAFALACLRGGDFPLWNPHLFAGIPFHASAHPALLYPPNALFLAAPEAAAFNALFALHVALAGLFTFALLTEVGARPAAALFGAIAFGFGARPLLHVAAGQASHAAALAWTPALFWLGERLARRPSAAAVVGLAASFACALLAGFPQYAAYAAIGLVAMAAGRWIVALAARRAPARPHARALALISVGLAGGALLAAAQVLPSLEAARTSFRAGGPKAFLTMGNLPIENFATLLFPAALGNVARAPYFGEWGYWNMCVYAGVGTLAFAALALVGGREARRRALPWALLGGGAFLIAVGDRTPLYDLFVRLPLLGSFRGVSKMSSLGLLAVAVLAGIGMESWLAGRVAAADRRPSGTRRLAILLAALAAAGVGARLVTSGEAGLARVARHYAAFASPNEHAPDGPRAPTPETLAAVRDAIAGDAGRVALFAGALLVVVAAAAARPRAARLAAPAATILLALDLFLALEPLLLTQSVARDIRLAPELAAAIRETPAHARYAASERRMMRGVLDGFTAAGGWEGNLPERTLAFMNAASDRPLDAPVVSFQPRRLSPLLDLLVAQRLVLDGAAPVDTSEFRLVAEGPRFAAYDRARDLPRAYLAHAVARTPDRAALWAAIRDGAHDPYAVAAILEDDARGTAADDPRADAGALPAVDPLPADAAEPRPEVLLDGPDRVVVRARPAARALLVLLDAYDPGWRAAVDGRPARVVPVFGFFRGVFLESGAREVVFSYAPRSFAVGGMLSLAGVAAALAVVAVGLARRHGRWRSRSISAAR